MRFCAKSAGGRVRRPRSGRAVVLVAALAAGWFAAGAGFAWGQAGFDRPTKDYTSFVVRSGDPAVCSARCESDPRCRAWGFRYPTPAGTRAQCFLKDEVPPRVADPCCNSGVRGAGVIERRGRQAEFSIDRWGGDYRSFEPTAPASEEACASACTAEDRCRAWTYVRPGYLGQAPRCYLKNRITPPRPKPCCISGVVR